MLDAGCGTSVLRVGAERVGQHVVDQRGEAGRPAGRIGGERGGAGRAAGDRVVPSRTSDGSACTAGLTWISRGEADIAALHRHAAAGRHVAGRIGEQRQALRGELAGQVLRELVQLGLVGRQRGVAQRDVGAELAAGELRR